MQVSRMVCENLHTRTAQGSMKHEPVQRAQRVARKCMGTVRNENRLVPNAHAPIASSPAAPAPATTSSSPESLDSLAASPAARLASAAMRCSSRTSRSTSDSSYGATGSRAQELSLHTNTHTCRLRWQTLQVAARTHLSLDLGQCARRQRLFPGLDHLCKVLPGARLQASVREILLAPDQRVPVAILHHLHAGGWSATLCFTQRGARATQITSSWYAQRVARAAAAPFAADGFFFAALDAFVRAGPSRKPSLLAISGNSASLNHVASARTEN